MIIQTQQGIGDCLYLRPVLKWMNMRDIILVTPWPQVFWDLPVRTAPPNSDMLLRTQRHNAERYQHYTDKYQTPNIQLSYNLRNGSIIHNYCEQLLGQQPTWFDNIFSVNPLWVKWTMERLKIDKSICLVRPNTIRREWPCPARNPNPQYLQDAVDVNLNKYYTISMFNTKEGEEWQTHKLIVDQEYNQWPIEIVFGMFHLAEYIICSPSFWSALAMAMNKPTLIIYGAHESHYAINDHRVYCDKVHYIEPEPFDTCELNKVNAYKFIPTNRLEGACSRHVAV